LNLSQHLFEPILLERVRGAVHYGHEWSGLEQDADGVTSRVRDLAAGRTYEVRSRYVLAADGAGSRIRRALDVAMDGPERVQAFIRIPFEANLRALVRERPAILYWVLDPEALGSFVAHDIERTWVFMQPHEPDLEPAESFTHERCAALVRRAIGADGVDVAVRD